MKPRGRHGFRAEPARDAKSDGPEPRMFRTNSLVQFQTGGLVGNSCCPASIIIGGAQQCRFVGRNKQALACMRLTCDTWGKENHRMWEGTMPDRMRYLMGLAVFAATAALTATPADAQKKYDPGASDTEIKIGNIMPYSGPASAYGVIGKTEEAYFRKINDEGGINGRKITFISYDDGYSPPKAVEQARKLVESDEVLALVSPMGTPSNSAIQKYLNPKKIPHLFPATNASKWADPVNFP